MTGNMATGDNWDQVRQSVPMIFHDYPGDIGGYHPYYSYTGACPTGGYPTGACPSGCSPAWRFNRKFNAYMFLGVSEVYQSILFYVRNHTLSTVRP